MISVTRSVGTPATVSAIVSAALWAGMTTITFGFRSATAGLNVDAAAPPQHDLCARRDQREWCDEHCGRQRRRAPAGRHGMRARVRRSDRLVEVEVAGKRADQPVEPPEQHLSA